MCVVGPWGDGGLQGVPLGGHELHWARLRPTTLACLVLAPAPRGRPSHPAAADSRAQSRGVRGTAARGCGGQRPGHPGWRERGLGTEAGPWV